MIKLSNILISILIVSLSIISVGCSNSITNEKLEALDSAFSLYEIDKAIKIINYNENYGIFIIIQYIKNNGQVDLSNSVSKVTDGIEKIDIGKFIYVNIREDKTFQQRSSQFVSIMHSIEVLHYNNKK